MAQLKVNGRLIVDNFYKKFEALYPYLNPALFYPKDIGGGEVDTSSTIANARARSVRQDKKGYTATGETEVSVTPDTPLEKFQEEMQKNFLVKCNINCRPAEKKLFGLGKTEYKWTAIGNTKYSNLTLGEANSQLEKDGAQKVTEIRTKGNDLGDKYL
jgi:hypothetical protein